MESEELMVGDLALMRVRNKGVFYPDVVASVTRLDWLEYKPIPITEEFLLANGFVRVNTQRYDLGTFGSYYYVKVNPKKNMIHVNGANANCNLYDGKYVHQLQHALRICGLTAIANNLKIA